MSGTAVAPVATVRQLDWWYGAGENRVQVLHSVDLDVADGEVVALMGPSGSGKSTLCHVVAGLEPLPPQAHVLVAGRPPAEHRDWATVAVVPQQHGLVPGLTIWENVALPSLRAAAPADAVHEVLDALDLASLRHHEATEVSLGEQQRAAIARALTLRPRLLVLDEPTGHQDSDHVDLVARALRHASAQGSALLMATHDEELAGVADRVVRLVEGRVG